MQPSLLVFGKMSSETVMRDLEQRFACRHLWQVAPDQRSAFIAAEGADIRAVLTTGTVGISGAEMSLLPKLELIAVHGVGVDRVDLAAAAARGIAVTNTPGVLTDDVADLALALVLGSSRNLVGLDRHVRSGAWAGRAPLAPGSSLRGKVAGIVGFGAIGQAIASRLAPCGVSVRYFQRSVVEGAAAMRSASLLALAHESDFLILAVPGGPATDRIVDAAVLQALGPTGTLVNIARGSVVDQPALIAALESGALGFAALDVFDDEPNVPAALRERDNVLLTPHAGSLTTETRYAMGMLALDNLLAFFAGEPLPTPIPPTH